MDQGRIPASHGDEGRQPPPPVRVEAAALFAGQDEIRLVHRGQEYRLRITKQGKLILTK